MKAVALMSHHRHPTGGVPRVTSGVQARLWHSAKKNQKTFLFPSPTKATIARNRLVCYASSLKVKESGTGVEFPLVERLWIGDDLRCMGASNRVKKIAFVGIKVYAVALYVEAQLAAKELGVRDRGGFFETDDDYCSALIDGAFVKSLEIELVRNIEGQQFVEALEESLRPRMALSGDMGSLQKLQDFFMQKKLTKGSVITLVYKLDSSLDICVRPSRPVSYEGEIPDLCIESPSLARALFETYLGASSIIPDARKEWADGARKLLESERIRRETRPGGSG